MFTPARSLASGGERMAVGSRCSLAVEYRPTGLAKADSLHPDELERPSGRK